MNGLLPVPTGTLRYRPVNDRIHNLFLGAIAISIGIAGLYLLQAAFLDGYGGFGMIALLFAAILKLAVARGFWKRKGWAFLLVSVSLLFAWMYELVLAIVETDHGGWADGAIHVYAFILVNFLIGYLGRRSMEERFRPHLIVH